MFQQEIINGSEYLDREFPGWYKNIDLDTLDMHSSQDCILGQLLGDYGDSFEGPCFNERHGFTMLGVGLNERLWSKLTEEWKSYIEERLSGE